MHPRTASNPFQLKAKSHLRTNSKDECARCHVTQENASHADNDQNKGISQVLLCQGVLYNTISALWKGQRADLSVLHVALHIHKQKFSSTPIFTTAMLGMTKVQLPSSGSSFWAKSVGSTHPHAPSDAAQRHAVPNRSEWCTASTGVSHHTINQPERTGRLSWQSLMDQVI